ncbi:hypothetical protein HZA57_01845 [Candidatus Poribacteria bacterium]|nr:hypothetical protein [Candidatus Poribacteria bacterium]
MALFLLLGAGAPRAEDEPPDWPADCHLAGTRVLPVMVPDPRSPAQPPDAATAKLREFVAGILKDKGLVSVPNFPEAGGTPSKSAPFDARRAAMRTGASLVVQYTITVTSRQQGDGTSKRPCFAAIRIAIRAIDPGSARPLDEYTAEASASSAQSIEAAITRAVESLTWTRGGTLEKAVTRALSPYCAGVKGPSGIAFVRLSAPRAELIRWTNALGALLLDPRVNPGGTPLHPVPANGDGIGAVEFKLPVVSDEGDLRNLLEEELLRLYALGPRARLAVDKSGSALIIKIR